MVSLFRSLALATTLIFTAFCFTRCESAKKELLQTVTPTCDTTNVTYSGTVAPIISANCLECHGNSVYTSLGDNNNLDGYSHIVNYAQPNGLLVNVIAHTPGYHFMPKDRPKLSDCDIAKITKWVNAGAPNN